MSDWIKCSERLPTEYQTVLVWHDELPSFVGPIIAFWTGKVWAQDLSRGDNFRVTHWQPLPEPPND